MLEAEKEHTHKKDERPGREHGAWFVGTMLTIPLGWAITAAREKFFEMEQRGRRGRRQSKQNNMQGII